VVDPRKIVLAPGCRQHVLNPLHRAWIEARDASAVHLTSPDLAVIVRSGRVERDVRRGRRILRNRISLRVVLDERAGPAADPDVPVGVEVTAARRYPAADRRHFADFSGLGVEPDDLAAAAAEISPVAAEEI